jgi:hypothetical protein
VRVCAPRRHAIDSTPRRIWGEAPHEGSERLPRRTEAMPSGRLADSQVAPGAWGVRMPGNARLCHHPFVGRLARWALRVCVGASTDRSIRRRIWDNVPDGRGVRPRQGASAARGSVAAPGYIGVDRRGGGCVPHLRARKRYPLAASTGMPSMAVCHETSLYHLPSVSETQGGHWPQPNANCQLQTANRLRQGSRAGADLAALGSPVPARAGAERRQVGAPHPARRGANQADRHRLWGDAGPVGAWREQSSALAAASPLPWQMAM